MSEIGTLTITDDLGNELIDIPMVPNGKISASVVASAIIAKISHMDTDIKILQGLVESLRGDIEDQKEAFEHADDSLQSLRTTVSAIKHQ